MGRKGKATQPSCDERNPKAIFTFLLFYLFTLLHLKLSSQSCQKFVESILVGDEHLARFRTLLSTYDAC